MTVRLAQVSSDPEPMRRIDEFVRGLDGALRKFLRRRVRCWDEADDLAQDVYLRLAGHPDLARVECLRAFAFQTALNLVRDRSRRCYTRSRNLTVSLDSIELPGGDDPIDQVVHDELLDQFESALNAMTPVRRRAFAMHRLNNVTYTEIGRSLGVSVSMVEKHISAALTTLRQAGKQDAIRCQPAPTTVGAVV